MGIKSHYLKDSDGNKFYPYAHANATFDENGIKVGTRLDNIESNVSNVSLDITEHVNDNDKHFTKTEREKLSNISEGADVNVQSDWNEADTTSDAFIKNKPTSLPANGGNADTVNRHTVEVDVPSNAKFTDTVYDDTELSNRVKNIEDDYIDSAKLELHANDETHIIDTERSNWNDANDKKHTHSNKTVLDNTTASFTEEEKTKLANIAENANAYTLPSAGTSLGGVKSGGDVTISNGVITVKDDSHAHVISNIDGLQNALDEKSSSTHNHDEVYDSIGAADSALKSSKSYTDTKVENLASTTVVDNKVSTHNTSTSSHNDIRILISDLTTKLNNFLDVDDTTKDQLSEVITLIENNKGTLESLTTSKINVSDIVDNLTTANASKVLSSNQGTVIKGLIDTLQSELDSHTHSIAEVNGLQSALDNKAESSHGTHVTYSSTKPVMDGTASVGSASSVARSDHKHPTDTSRASASDLTSHTSNTTSHITSTERTNWNVAKTHADSTHAPSNAEKNSIVGIQKNGTDLTIDSNRKVNITVPTKVSELSNDSKFLTSHPIINKNEDSTSEASPAHSETVTVIDKIVRDDNGHVTSINTKTVTLPKDNNTDTKVKQSVVTTDGEFPVLLRGTAAGTTTTTTTASFASNVKVNPSNGTLTANDFIGKINGHSVDSDIPSDAKFTDTVYTHPSYTAKSSGLYKITVDSTGHVSNVTAVAKSDITALGIPSSDTNTHYTSKNVVNNSTSATSDTASALTNGNVYLVSVENGVATSAHKISGSGATTVTTDASGNIVISSTDTNTTYSKATSSKLGLVKIGYTESGKNYPVELNDSGQMYVNVPWADNNTTYGAASSSLGLVKSGGDVTISSGVITVNDDSHNHTISNVDNLQTTLDTINTGLDGSIKALSVSGKTITYTKNDGTTGTITTQDTNTTYGAMTGATSSTAGKAGLVPAPASGKQTSFLRGDGTWVVPTNTTYSNMTAATSSAAGKAGLVPAPAAGAQAKFLRGDGTWQTPTNTTYSAATTSTAGLMSASDKSKLDGIASGANAYSLPTASSSTLGGVKTTSTVTSTSGLTACPIISGVPYYKDTNTTYTHPTTSGNKHIPSGGSSGQFLKWSEDGTAVWASDNNTKNTAGSTNTSSKIFLIGATSQATSPQTYSHDTAYVGTDGCLYSNSTRVRNEVDSTTEPTNQLVGDYWNLEY